MSRRRLNGLLIVVACFLASASDATAGTYEVRACNAAPGGVNRSWFPEINYGTTAYQVCPGAYEDTGMVARVRALEAGTTTPLWSLARWVFRAPPGAAVVGLRGNGTISAYGRSWQAGVSNGSYLIVGCVADQIRNAACASALAESIPFSTPPVPAIYTEVLCIFAPCSTQYTAAAPGHVRARVILYSAIVTVSDATVPTIGGIGDELWTSAWTGGRRMVRFDATDNVGIREVRALIDGRVMRAASRDCDPAEVRCPDWPGVALDVPTYEGVADGAHTLTLQAIDRAGNVGQVSRQILVDNTPPAAPENIAVSNGDGWRSGNRFTVAWRNPSQRDRAPVAAAHYTLCPEGRTTGCLSGSRPGTDVQELRDLVVPSAGAWDLRVWLRDAAGNARAETAAPPVKLRFDDEPPALTILAPDPDEPARVSVKATDAVSGVGRGEIEIRRAGANAWSATNDELRPGGFSALIDDEHLRDGVYEIRARAFDAAGNERSTDRAADGAAATVRMPVRVKTRLQVGQIRKVRARRTRGGRRRTRTIYVSRPRVSVGHRVRVSGRLTAPGGNPLQAVAVEVSAQADVPGASAQPVASLTTTQKGRFTYLVPAGPSRTLRFRYPGAAKIRPQTRVVSVRVQAGSSIRASRRHVVNGEDVTFRGRLRGGWIPTAGKLVEVQFYARGRWRTFATTRAGADGRWSYPYRFDGTRGTVRWRFRARVPREAAYPFTPGASRQVRVTVHGL